MLEPRTPEVEEEDGMLKEGQAPIRNEEYRGAVMWESGSHMFLKSIRPQTYLHNFE